MQWRCSVCNSQSPVGSGGICARCRKFACSRHLKTVLTVEKKIKVCTSCLTGEDHVQKGIFERLFGSKA
jgi:hypothetical protein